MGARTVVPGAGSRRPGSSGRGVGVGVGVEVGVGEGVGVGGGVDVGVGVFVGWGVEVGVAVASAVGAVVGVGRGGRVGVDVVASVSSCSEWGRPKNIPPTTNKIAHRAIPIPHPIALLVRRNPARGAGRGCWPKNSSSVSGCVWSIWSNLERPQ
jgi:hypothetical protein